MLAHLAKAAVAAFCLALAGCDSTTQYERNQRAMDEALNAGNAATPTGHGTRHR